MKERCFISWFRGIVDKDILVILGQDNFTSTEDPGEVAFQVISCMMFFLLIFFCNLKVKCKSLMTASLCFRLRNTGSMRISRPRALTAMTSPCWGCSPRVTGAGPDTPGQSPVSMSVCQWTYPHDRTVSPICLPEPWTSFPQDTECLVSGWGKTKRECVFKIYLVTLHHIPPHLITSYFSPWQDPWWVPQSCAATPDVGLPVLSSLLLLLAGDTQLMMMMISWLCVCRP